jgi:hypothetical protein
MTWTHHGRRAVTVLLVLLALLAVPAIAEARFSANRSAGLATGTDTLETPSNLTGSYRCTRSGGTEYLSVTVTSFTDAGPSSSYGFGLALGTSVKDSATSTTRRATLDASRSYDGQSTTWTVGIQGYLARWSSGIGTENIVCPASGNKTGTF